MIIFSHLHHFRDLKNVICILRPYKRLSTESTHGRSFLIQVQQFNYLRKKEIQLKAHNKMTTHKLVKFIRRPKNKYIGNRRSQEDYLDYPWNRVQGNLLVLQYVALLFRNCRLELGIASRDPDIPAFFKSQNFKVQIPGFRGQNLFHFTIIK